MVSLQLSLNLSDFRRSFHLAERQGLVGAERTQPLSQLPAAGAGKALWPEGQR